MTKERDRLIRMEVEVKNLKEQNSIDHNAIMEQISCMRQDMRDFTKQAKEAIEEKADKSEFLDLRNRVYGIATAVILAFVGILVYLIEFQFK